MDIVKLCKNNEKYGDLCHVIDVINNFIEDNDITCAEHIYQEDFIIENALYFIEDICSIVGYKDVENEETE